MAAAVAHTWVPSMHAHHSKRPLYRLRDCCSAIGIIRCTAQPWRLEAVSAPLACTDARLDLLWVPRSVLLLLARHAHALRSCLMDHAFWHALRGLADDCRRCPAGRGLHDSPCDQEGAPCTMKVPHAQAGLAAARTGQRRRQCNIVTCDSPPYARLDLVAGWLLCNQEPHGERRPPSRVGVNAIRVRLFSGRQAACLWPPASPLHCICI